MYSDSDPCYDSVSWLYRYLTNKEGILDYTIISSPGEKKDKESQIKIICNFKV